MKTRSNFSPAEERKAAWLAQKEDWPCSISGNNVDGFVITQWNGALLRSRLSQGRERGVG